jgi:disulfide bond formation protein DsbB
MATVLAMNKLTSVFNSRRYWAGLALIGVAALAVALYYQYGVGDEPCQVCIHARLWVVALVLTGAVMCLLPLNRGTQLVANLVVLVSGAGLGERAWYLYQLENGIGNGSCQFELGMPDWFAVDRWFPSLFEVRNLCSFTPEMLLGLSMAESLMLFAIGLCLTATTALFMPQQPQQ